MVSFDGAVLGRPPGLSLWLPCVMVKWPVSLLTVIVRLSKRRVLMRFLG